MLLTLAWRHYLHSLGSSVLPPRDATTLVPSKGGEGSIEDAAVTCSSSRGWGLQGLGGPQACAEQCLGAKRNSGVSLSCPYGTLHSHHGREGQKWNSDYDFWRVR